MENVYVSIIKRNYLSCFHFLTISNKTRDKFSRFPPTIKCTLGWNFDVDAWLAVSKINKFKNKRKMAIINLMTLKCKHRGGLDFG